MSEVWDSIYVWFFQHLSHFSLFDIENMNYKEYILRREAERRRKLEEENRIHKQAYLNYIVEATEEKRKGKHEPVYKTYKDFFNYEEEKKNIVGLTSDVKVVVIEKEEEVKDERKEKLRSLMLEANKGGE